MRITVNGKRSEISIHRKVDPKKWNHEAGKLRGTKSEVKAFNTYLDFLKSKVYDAHLRLKNDNEDISSKAIKNEYLGIIVSKMHLAEFFQRTKDTIKAINYAKDANILAKKIKNNRDYLASLKLLSILNEKDAKGYLEKYIKYNDSLQNFEREIQNRFTRIAFETDEYIEETEYLSRQKTWIIIISLVVLLLLSLIYYIHIQNSRNKNLLLETEQ